MEDFWGIVLGCEGDNILASGGVAVLATSERSTGEGVGMAYTAECLHGFHSACNCENACDCRCHAPNLDEDSQPVEFSSDDEGDNP